MNIGWDASSSYIAATSELSESDVSNVPDGRVATVDVAHGGACLPASAATGASLVSVVSVVSVMVVVIVVVTSTETE